jgi:hypothetical protein
MRQEEEENKNEFLEKSSENKRISYNYQSHINELLKEIISYNRNDGFDKFEEISMYIKKKMTKLSFQYFKPEFSVKSSFELNSNEQKIIVIINL